MKIFNTNLDAIEYINQTDLEYWEKQSKIININNQGITKIKDTILVVDEYNILK